MSEAPGPPSFYRKLVFKLKQQASVQKLSTVETAVLFKFMERIFKVWVVCQRGQADEVCVLSPRHRRRAQGKELGF